jgi:hypothetical protein
LSSVEHFNFPSFSKKHFSEILFFSLPLVLSSFIFLCILDLSEDYIIIETPYENLNMDLRIHL